MISFLFIAVTISSLFVASLGRSQFCKDESGIYVLCNWTKRDVSCWNKEEERWQLCNYAKRDVSKRGKLCLNPKILLDSVETVFSHLLGY